MDESTEIKIIKSELEKLKNGVYEIIEFIEDSDEYQYQIDKDIKRHFYHLFIKCKRNFKAINILMESQDLENSYIEATVLLRVLTEGYLHLCYLIKAEKDVVIEEYKAMSEFQLQKMLRGTNRQYKLKINNKTDLKIIRRLKNEILKKEIKLPYHFEKMHSLAKKTDNQVFYGAIYQMFNTYVHFNPTTYISYGTEDENGTFNFDSYKPKPFLEARILYFSISVQMTLLARTMKYLEIEKTTKNIINHFNEWDTFLNKKKRGRIILSNTDDYI
ncbi:hypothetical protein SAMN05878482_103492 [Peribacillus simplex]|uniref:Uncharacterized protein n=1 Tax=Peribacillus simplex TaxID=1478 RepID=A0A9X8WKU4_9BACI|nr:DUF5677 domain-containing protein [Peribacillus simplex]SIR38374.1 hypothetical protein SAMN05878482_103492 [Peribacillus simplex]